MDHKSRETGPLLLQNEDKAQEKLYELLYHLSHHSPFYRRMFTKNDININEIRNVFDLPKIPVTTKSDLQDANWDFLCVPKKNIAEYCTSSGTMGHPVSIALTESDMQRLAQNELCSFLTTGGHAGEVYQLMLTLDKLFMAGIAYYTGIRSLGATVVRVGPNNPAIQLDHIFRYMPDVLVAVPSFLVKMVKYATDKGIDLASSSVKKVICIGENIRNEDFKLNAIGKRITDAWDISLFSTYASTEMQTSFTECEYGRGGHHNPDLLIFEILDENDNPLPAGVYGELTITTLGVKGMPLLRYKTGDICAYYDDPCPCGRTSARISPIRGRKYHLIKYNGTTLYPQTINNILNNIPEVLDYVIELSASELGTDHIIIHLNIDERRADTDSNIKQALKNGLRVVPSINYLSTEEIRIMQLQEDKRKVVKLIDKR